MSGQVVNSHLPKWRICYQDGHWVGVLFDQRDEIVTIQGLDNKIGVFYSPVPQESASDSEEFETSQEKEKEQIGLFEEEPPSPF